jgi:predicted RNA methylase
MYGGMSKSEGGTVGKVITGEGLVDLEEASDGASADEFLNCLEPISKGEISGEGVNETEDSYRQVYYEAYLEEKSGDLKWRPHRMTKVTGKEGLVEAKIMGMGQMVSMLHDVDRNSMYEEALRRCITYFQEKTRRSPTLLDVGTGTGLLAMLGIRHGAQVAIGCEMYEPMAEVASQVVKDNKLSDEVTIIAAKSTEIDLGGKVDILVSELLDSTLLGEGCLLSHNDALKRLVYNDNDIDTNSNIGSVPICQRVIPNRAEVYASLISAPMINHYTQVSSKWFADTLSPFRRSSDQHCRSGANTGLPVHWEQLQEYITQIGEHCEIISENIKALSFSFYKIY